MPIRRIFTDISELLNGAPILVLDADVSSGASSITVQSITGVAINNILLFREPGNERSEIIATHASSSPSGTTVTLASTLVQSHPAGTKIYIIKANRITFYSATTAVDANSDASSLSTLASSQAIDPTTIKNFYDDQTQTSGYYFYRFSDSVNSVNLLYSDAIPWGQVNVQFTENEVGYMLEFARRKLDHEWDNHFSKQVAMQEVNSCLRYIQGKLKRWPRYLVANYAIGQTARGILDFALPSDIYDNETNQSILSVRIGTANDPLTPLEEKEFDNILRNTKQTTVRTLAVVGATTLNIVNSYDFTDTGSVNISTSNTVDAITYTGITRSATAGVLTGIPATGSGSIAVAHAVGQNVWQGEQEGQPQYFNVRQGRIRIGILPDSTWINKNVFLDYTTEVTKVDSESDTIDVLRYDMVMYWLLWQGKNYWRNNGKQDLQDGDFIMFQDILKSAIRTMVTNQKYKMKPKINTIDYRTKHGEKRFDFT